MFAVYTNHDEAESSQTKQGKTETDWSIPFTDLHICVRVCMIHDSGYRLVTGEMLDHARVPVCSV